jgi:hypothetical protein
MMMAKLSMAIKHPSSAGRFNDHGGTPVQYKNASPDGAYTGLYWKPLDAAIKQLLALYSPSGRQGNSK